MALVQAASNTGNGAVTVTLGAQLTSGNLVVVWADVLNITRTLTPSDNGSSGIAWSTAIGPIDNASGVRGYLFYRLCGSSDATQITVTPNTGTIAQNVIVLEFDGSPPASPLDQTGSGTNSTTTNHNITGTVTTTQADEVLVGGVGASSAAAFTAGGGYTLPAGGSSTHAAMQYRIVSAISNYDSPTTSAANENTVSLLATFKLGGGGGPGPSTRKNLTLLGVS